MRSTPPCLLLAQTLTAVVEIEFIKSPNSHRYPEQHHLLNVFFACETLHLSENS